MGFCLRWFLQIWKNKSSSRFIYDLDLDMYNCKVMHSWVMVPISEMSNYFECCHFCLKGPARHICVIYHGISYLWNSIMDKEIHSPGISLVPLLIPPSLMFLAIATNLLTESSIQSLSLTRCCPWATILKLFSLIAVRDFYYGDIFPTGV